MPYIFSIKNTGNLDSYISIKLVEDKEYVLNEKYSNYISILEEYPDHLTIGISDCTKKMNRDDVKIYKYDELENYVILSSDYLKSDGSKTYCLWTWLDEFTPNEAQSTYFVANLDFEAEYKPK